MLTRFAGSITQWGEVSKVKKDRSRSKVKDTTTTQGETGNTGRASRGGRAGFDGRGRGRGGSRGGRGSSVAHINGRTKENTDSSVPTAESSPWDTAAPTDDTATWDAVKPVSKPSGDESWSATATGAASSTATASAKVASSIIPDGVKKSWASMFAAPAPAPKKASEPVEKYKIHSPFNVPPPY